MIYCRGWVVGTEIQLTCQHLKQLGSGCPIFRGPQRLLKEYSLLFMQFVLNLQKGPRLLLSSSVPDYLSMKTSSSIICMGLVAESALLILLATPRKASRQANSQETCCLSSRYLRYLRVAKFHEIIPGLL